MARSEERAQLLDLAHTVLEDLRTKVDGGDELKPRLKLKPIKGVAGWSLLAAIFALGGVRPSLVRFSKFALEHANALLEHNHSQWLHLTPQHFRPAWVTARITG